MEAPEPIAPFTTRLEAYTVSRKAVKDRLLGICFHQTHQIPYLAVHTDFLDIVYEVARFESNTLKLKIWKRIGSCTVSGVEMVPKSTRPIPRSYLCVFGKACRLRSSVHGTALATGGWSRSRS